MVLSALAFKNKEIFAENSDWEAAADFAFMFTVVTALVILGTAVCGCMTAKHQGILKYIFGVFLLIVTILLFVVTALIGGAANFSEDDVQDVCNGETPIEELSYITSIDDFANDWVGRYMCTSYCPCIQSEDTTGAFSALTRTELESFYPSRSGGIYWGTSGDSSTYSTFADCFSTNTFFSDDQDVVDQDIIDLVNYLETTYECSGVCNPGYFYWTLGLSSGIP